MQVEVRLLKLLLARRRLERSFFVNAKVTFKAYLYSKLELFRALGPTIALVYSNKRLWIYLDNYIPTFARKNNLLQSKTSIEIANAKNNGFYPDWFDKLEIISTRLETIDALLIVQGSYADGMITNYSDVDLVIFYKTISPELIELKEELERFILDVDPIQHHGVFMIGKQKLSAYWQMDLPVEVISRGKCFGNTTKSLNFDSIISESLGPTTAVRSTLVAMEVFINRNFEEVGIYAWKLLLSQIMLIPTLFLATKNKSIYKRESFDLVKDYYSSKAWDVIVIASSIRKSWIDSSDFNHYISKRNNSSQSVRNDDLKVFTIPSISLDDKESFYSSLRLFIKETRELIND